MPATRRPFALPSSASALLALALGLGSSAGCDGGDAEKTQGDKQREAAAAAMLGGESVHSQAQKEDEERRKKAFAERKAKEEAEAKAFADAMAKIIGLPEPMPKDLNEACTGLIESWETFVKNSNVNDDGAILKFYDNKGEILGERKAKCMKLGSLEAAACSAKALAAADETFKDKGLEILTACADKYAPGAGGPVQAPPAE